MNLPSRNGLTISTRVPGFEFRIARTDRGIEQLVKIETSDGPLRHGEFVDVIMGSGKYGQTYLYWKQDHLYQLPFSYLSYRQKWALSPGYSDVTAD